jgi:sugar-specific transcriptional regulator TrmB
MNKEVQEVLERFGMGGADRRVYLALVASGPSTASPIARATGLPPTTVQSAAARLADMGAVTVSKRKSRSVYEADDPAVLRRILDRQAEEMSGIIPMLQRMRSSPVVSPKIRVYQRERAADIFHAALRSRDKLVYEIVSAKNLQGVLGEKFHFTRRRVQAGVRLNSLRVEANEIKRYSCATHARELREARFLPRDLTFRSSVLFWDDTVACFTAEGEGLAWTVESVTFREMFEQLFKLLWSVSRRMETAS